MKKLIIGSFSLLFASVMAAPAVRAETETMREAGTTRNQPATQLERLRQQTNGRYQQTDTDTQVGQPETGTDWQQAPTQTEQLQQQTETEGMDPTQTGQPETGTDWQQAPTQTEQLQQQTETEGMDPTQTGQPETGTDWQQAPTQTEQLQQQTETEGMDPTQTGQPETGTDWQQAPTQTEQLQQQTETEGMDPTQRGTQQAGDYETDAFNLVNSAYRGELQKQGIPSYSQLIRDYNIGQVTAEDVVEAAIEADMVSPETMEDEEYLNAVNLQLEALVPTR
jgi:hypothetical protein